MKIVLHSDEIFRYQVISNLNLGLFQGNIFLSKEEVEHIKSICSTIWKKLINKTKMGQSFFGHIRFDLVPDILEQRQEGRAVFISFKIGGIYEINAHSPECACACSAVKLSGYDLPKSPWPAEKLALKIRELLGDKHSLVFVPGNGTIKQKWGNYFIQDLVKHYGLNIQVLNPEEVMKKKPPVIWRWGDIRFSEEDEFPLYFQEWLLNDFREGFVFNTIPSRDFDIADKGLLISENFPQEKDLIGDNFIINQSIFNDPLVKDKVISKKDNLVVKPLRGSSGLGVVFGRHLSNDDWLKFLISISESSKGDFGLFEARWLPQIKFNKNTFVIDINPSFFANGEELYYLYTVVRADKWFSYWKRGTINVAQGGGFVGCCVEEE